MTIDLESAVVRTKKESFSPKPNNNLSLTNRIIRKEDKSFDTDGLEDMAGELIKELGKTVVKTMVKPYGFMDLAMSTNARLPWVISGLYVDIMKNVGAIIGAGYGAFQAWKYFQ